MKQTKNPANRIRTSDLRITVENNHYSPPLYQLSYRGMLFTYITYQILIHA